MEVRGCGTAGVRPGRDAWASGLPGAGGPRRRTWGRRPGAPRCAGRAVAPGERSRGSSLGVRGRPGAAWPLALSSRLANLNHAGLAAPSPAGGAQGQRGGYRVGRAVGGTGRPIAHSGLWIPGHWELGDPGAPLPGGRRARTD